MSLILDALKKLEQEKNSRKGKIVELGQSIVAEQPTRRASRWRIVALIAAAVAATAICTVLLMKQISPTSPGIASNAPPPALPAAAPSPALPAPQTADAPAAVHVENTAKTDAQPAPVRRRAIVVAPPPQPAYEPPPAAATIPDLSVSGIAWQEERKARRAVVNGILVGEGALVSGAVVREIQPERVRFTVGNQSVDVPNSTPFR